MSPAIAAPPDVLEIFLQPGDLYFGGEKTRIRTLLGSCVAIVLWHPHLRIGGMCHYLLPNRPTRRTDEPLDGRYAEEAMQLFLAELRHSGTVPSDYQAKLFGGGQMFKYSRTQREDLDISTRNAQIGRALLEKEGFKVRAHDLGGQGHRNVIFDLWSGDVWLRRAPAQKLI
jgi:chemotaxis protein CheD